MSILKSSILGALRTFGVFSKQNKPCDTCDTLEVPS